MEQRFKTTRLTGAWIVACSLAVVWGVGCNGSGGAKGDGAITETPSNWGDLVERDLTVRGSAANSRTGPGLRLDDGSLLMLDSVNGWPVVVVGRPVEMKGRVVAVEDSGSVRYMLRATSWELYTPPPPPVEKAPPPVKQPPTDVNYPQPTPVELPKLPDRIEPAPTDPPSGAPPAQPSGKK